MHLIVCIDDRDGMSFCGRRLSRDRELNAHILKLTAGRNLWMSAYSAKLFPNAVVMEDEAFLYKAGPDDYCFAETVQLPATCENIGSLTLYCWNRSYPATVKFPRELLKSMRLESSEEFSGHSHERITVERYVK